MKKHRTSKVQKQILKCLVSGLKTGHKDVKSTVLNFAVRRKLTEEAKEEINIHPNHFRASCALLVERGLIMRWKENLDWFICITPDGIDFLEKLNDE
ncbi:hypothetical protein P7245_22500 [Vibrio parahaemolyticus]|nr:hypothetical protein [Vibrio parahaemolyticus]